MRITIIVLNWNGGSTTIKCLDSLRQLLIPAGCNVTLLIIDNASTDTSIGQIVSWINASFTTISNSTCGLVNKNSWQNCTLLQNSCNLGYAGGMNVGLHYTLTHHNPDFLWLLNNDTTVTEDALANLLACALIDTEIAMWGSTILFTQAAGTCTDAIKLRVKSAGGCRYNRWLTSYCHVGGGATLAQVQAWPSSPRLDYVDGAAMFIKRSAMDVCGLLNTDYFLYFEELDYAQRLRHHNLAIAWCRKSIIFHHGGVAVQHLVNTTTDPRHTPSYHADLSCFKYTYQHHRNILKLAMLARIVGRIIKIFLASDLFKYAARALFKYATDALFKHTTDANEVGDTHNIHTKTAGTWTLLHSLWLACRDFWQWQAVSDACHHNHLKHTPFSMWGHPTPQFIPNKDVGTTPTTPTPTIMQAPIACVNKSPHLILSIACGGDTPLNTSITCEGTATLPSPQNQPQPNLNGGGGAGASPTSPFPTSPFGSDHDLVA